MNDNNNYSDDIYNDNQEGENDLLHEVQDLVWALVDEYITDDQIQRLQNLMLEDDQARRIYVQCMQLHSDLYYQFGGQTSEKAIGDLASTLGLPESVFNSNSTNQDTPSGSNPTAPILDINLPTDALPNNNSMS